MKHSKAIIISCIVFGVLSIALGNLEQYDKVQEYFSMVGILSILWSGAFYITIKQEGL